MSALTQAFNSSELADGGRQYIYPVEANTNIYLGGIVMLNAAGNAVPASAAAGLKCAGRAEAVFNATSPGKNAINNPGTAGAISIICRRGVFMWNNGSGADAVAAANALGLAWALDDHTVSPLDGTLTTVTAEALTTPTGSGQVMPLGHSYVQRGSVVITNSGASVTYVEGTDYAVGYDSGLVALLAGGAIAGGGVALKATFKWSGATRSPVGRIVGLDISGNVFVDTRVMPSAYAV